MQHRFYIGAAQHIDHLSHGDSRCLNQFNQGKQMLTMTVQKTAMTRVSVFFAIRYGFFMAVLLCLGLATSILRGQQGEPPPFSTFNYEWDSFPALHFYWCRGLIGLTNTGFASTKLLRTKADS